jgi:hypothetical protein
MNFQTFYWQHLHIYKTDVNVKLSQCLLRRHKDSMLMTPLSPEFRIGRKKNFKNFVFLSLCHIYVHFILTYTIM